MASGEELSLKHRWSLDTIQADPDSSRLVFVDLIIFGVVVQIFGDAYKQPLSLSVC